MIFQAVLVLINLAVMAYVLTQRNKSTAITAVVLLACIAGIGMALFPDITNVAAQYVGVGRGADLIFYCWVVISFALIINMQLKLIVVNRQMTDLARSIALRHAESGESGPQGPSVPAPKAASGPSKSDLPG